MNMSRYKHYAHKSMWIEINGLSSVHVRKQLTIFSRSSEGYILELL